MKVEFTEIENSATKAITELHKNSVDEYTSLLTKHSELERHIAKTERERKVYDEMATGVGLVANDLGESPAEVSMAKQIVTRIMATVEQMKDTNGQNAIVQALARMPAEILPGRPVIEEEDQVAPEGFGLSEKQLAEHTERRKRQHEEKMEWHHWQTVGWYEAWSLPVPDPDIVTPSGVGDGDGGYDDTAHDSPGVSNARWTCNTQFNGGETW